MENNQTDPNKTGTMPNQKPNEDPNRKQPEQKGPVEKNAETDPEVPNFDIKKKGNPDDVRMNKDAGNTKPESDTTDDEEDNDADEKRKSDTDSQDKERTNKVTL